jgi:hypothetical protein
MSQIEPLFILNRRTSNPFAFKNCIDVTPGVFIRGKRSCLSCFSRHSPFLNSLESSSRIYSPYVFAIGQLIGEIPYSIICGVLYWVLMVSFPCLPYLIITNQWLGLSNGLWSGQRGHKWHWIPTADHHFHVALRSYVGANGRCFIPQYSGEHPPPSSFQCDIYIDRGPHTKVAVLFNPFIALVLATFCGVTIPYPTMIKFWRSWLYQLDPYTRTLAAMVSTEL